MTTNIETWKRLSDILPKVIEDIAKKVEESHKQSFNGGKAARTATE